MKQPDIPPLTPSLPLRSEELILTDEIDILDSNSKPIGIRVTRNRLESDDTLLLRAKQVATALTAGYEKYNVRIT